VPTALDYTFAIMIQHGTVSRSQRLRSAAGILASFFALYFFQFDAISVKTTNFPFILSIDWTKFINPYGWLVLLIIVSVICFLNILFSISTSWDNAIRRKFFLTISIVCDLAILCFFKYFNFFTDSFAILAKNIFGLSIGANIIKIILPVGISFYVFKTISYIVDVYRNDIESSKSFLDYATYLAFFPQLLAGPIDRAGTLLKQIQKSRPALTSNDMREAIWLFVWGLFKKVVVADNMSLIVNEIFRPYDILSAAVTVPEDGLRMLIGVYAFTIQIYGDFSGYTDMSRGVAKLLGFDTMLNFNLPYFSITPGIFWRRWHISLSTWLRDYLYIPLGGNRCSKIKMYNNIMITMILGGLWHGAAWTFVLWGGYHGLLLVVYRILGIEENYKNYSKWKKIATGLITFHLIAFGWLIFRAKNITTVMVFLQSIFVSPFGSIEAWEYFISIIKFSWFLLLFQIIQAWLKKLDPVFSFNWFQRLNIWIYIIIALLTFTLFRKPEFIYFAF
jgi:D-alanyl-lipoteichoic acid acyltransferase DltB (MBOAT superfamily)